MKDGLKSDWEDRLPLAKALKGSTVGGTPDEVCLQVEVNTTARQPVQAVGEMG